MSSFESGVLGGLATADYVVALRGPSSALLPRDQPLQLTVNTASGIAEFTVNTRFVSSGFADPVPRGLWVDARGKAQSLNIALNEFANIANFLSSFLALTTNAKIGELQPELGYHATPGMKRREYFQQSLPEGPGTIQMARQGNPQVTLDLIRLVNSHPDSELLQRAVVQYGQALEHWRPGREVATVAHLWMGLEALTPLIRHQTCRDLRIPEEKWKSDWRAAVEADDSLKDSRIRRDVLFQGDDETYRNAKEAMDGYEHGFMAFTAVRDQAAAARDQTASYLRTAIVTLSGLDKEKRDVLFSPEYVDPFDAVPISKYLRGTLISDTDELAAPGQVYPILTWSTKLVDLSRTTDGQYKARFKERYIAQLGKGVAFEARSLEMWGPADATRLRKAGPGALFEYEIERNTTDVPLTSKEHVQNVLEVLRMQISAHVSRLTNSKTEQSKIFLTSLKIGFVAGG
jgi:hypothetical protein